MRVNLNLELDYDLMRYLAGKRAKIVALSWADGCDLSNKNDCEALFETAFADGMNYMLDLLKPQIKED